MARPRHARTRLILGQDFASIGCLLLLGVGLPLLVSSVAGTLEIPRNDDWSYRLIAMRLAETGSFTLDGISETMLIGQIAFTQPFLWIAGLNPWAFAAAGVVFAIGGILGAFALARVLLPSRDAAFAAALLALFPGYLAYATSYMSDVPALAAQFLCLTFGMIAVRGRNVRVGWLVASASMGVFAFSIREFAVAAPVAVMIAAVLVDRSRLRSLIVALGVAASFVAIHLWRSALPGQLPPVGPGFGALGAVVQAGSSIAFVIAPAALVGAIRWRKHIRLFDLLVGLEVGLILAVARLSQWLVNGDLPAVIMQNLTSPVGAPGPYMVGGRAVLFPDPTWTVINGLALGGTVVVLAIGTGVAGAYVRRGIRSLRGASSIFGSQTGILVLFSLAVLGGLTVFGLTRPLFDRYFWAVVPVLVTLFLFVPSDLRPRASEKTHRLVDMSLAGSAAIFTVVLASVSLVFLVNSHAFDASRWSAGEALARAGIPVDEIDAGYEWVGYHATSQGDPTKRTSSETFYGDWWPDFKRCGLVSADGTPPDNGELLGTVEYELNLVAGPTETLYLYRFIGTECTAGE